MNADFLSGLLLLAVVLAGVAYLIKEFFWESIVTFASKRRSPASPQPESASSGRAPSAPTGTNDHLLGAVGRVVDDGARSGKIRVRVGMETWLARVAPPEADVSVGTSVIVRSIHGRVLEVAERPAEAEGRESAEAQPEAAEVPIAPEMRDSSAETEIAATPAAAKEARAGGLAESSEAATGAPGTGEQPPRRATTQD
jgi:membrane protein implicated in regulation of membrane protease activity